MWFSIWTALNGFNSFFVDSLFWAIKLTYIFSEKSLNVRCFSLTFSRCKTREKEPNRLLLTSAAICWRIFDFLLHFFFRTKLISMACSSLKKFKQFFLHQFFFCIFQLCNLWAVFLELTLKKCVKNWCDVVCSLTIGLKMVWKCFENGLKMLQKWFKYGEIWLGNDLATWYRFNNFDAK